MKSWKKLLFSIFSQAMILMLVILTGQLVFATCDDTVMVSLASGGYGKPSPYICNMHMLAGFILSKLFSITAIINWVTLFYLFVLSYSFLILDYIFFKCETIQSGDFCIKLCIIDICWTILLSYFTFTVIAYISGSVGLIAITCKIFINKENKGLYINGLCLLLLSGLIRGEVLKSLLIIFFAVVIYGIIYEKNFKYFRVWILAFAVMILLQFSNVLAVSCDNVQKDFLAWGETRSAALDCAVVPYDMSLFEENNVSYYQYCAAYNAFYYCYDSVDRSTLNFLKKNNRVTNKYNFDIIGFVPCHFAFLQNMIDFQNIYKVVFYSIFVIRILLGDRKTRKFSLFIYGTTISTEFIFYFIQRNLYRVVMPNYIFSILLLLYFGKTNPRIRTYLHENYISIDKTKKILTSICILFASISRVYCSAIPSMDYYYSNDIQRVLSYMEDNNQNIYLAGDASVFSVGVCHSVWTPVGAKNGWNMIGNWETYSVPYFSLMEQHHVSDPYNVLREAINNDNILLLTSTGDSFPTNYVWILGLIKQYYDIDASFQKVTNISGNWCVYKIIDY